MPHASSWRCSLPSNEAHYRFGDVLCNVGRSVFFRCATNFANQYHSIGFGILLKFFKALDKR
jgi:hypothetical protein